MSDSTRDPFYGDDHDHDHAATTDPTPAPERFPSAAVAGVGQPGGTPTGTITHAGSPTATLVPIGVPPERAPALKDGNVYVAQPGDSLPLIAEKFGQVGNWRALHRENYDAIYDAGVIYPGQEIVIPSDWLRAADESPATV